MKGTIVIRRSTDQDVHAMARLAALDSRSAPAEGALLALVDGELRAALAPEGGELVADPFERTDWLGELLRLRAAQEPSQGGQNGRARGERRSLGGRQLLRWRTGEARA